MRSFFPKSFLKLLIAAFCLVAAPLMFALLNNAVSIRHLADQSESAVYQAVRATEASRMLAEQLSLMERSARQYAILGDASLLDGYFLAHGKFEETARQLAAVPLPENQKGLLKDLVERERGLYQRISSRTPEAVKSAVDEFIGLADIARANVDQGNILVEREVVAMRDMADRARDIIFWQLLALIPVAMVLVAGFTLLLDRPIRQIDEAIRRLGSGDFGNKVVVEGPQDLQHLGERLDWMRARVVELEEQKNKFLRHVSHELKTPLAALREGGELLKDGAVGALSGEQQEVAAIICENSVRLQRLIEDLLTYQTAQFQKSWLHLSEVSIQPLLHRVAEDHRLALQAKDMRLDIECPDLAFEGDLEKIRVTVDNLMSNAVKFSPRGSTIRVRVMQRGEQVELDVLDSGPGIPAQEKDKVFDPFYQGSARTFGPVKGSGLGLSIAREYAVAHGGGVEVLDPGEPGAHFRVTLPLKQKEEKHEMA